MENCIIVGCGGIGSNLAYFLIRSENPPTRMILIDYDIVTEKNLSRQFFTKSDIGQNKAIALKNNLEQFTAYNIQIDAFPEKITTDLLLIPALLNQFAPFPCYLFCCTDNLLSKRIVAKQTKDGKLYTVYIGCEQEFFEINNNRDKTLGSSWSRGDGYSSNQTAFSNLAAALRVKSKIELGYNFDNEKIDLKKWFMVNPSANNTRND